MLIWALRSLIVTATASESLSVRVLLLILLVMAKALRSYWNTRLDTAASEMLPLNGIQRVRKINHFGYKNGARNCPDMTLPPKGKTLEPFYC